MNYPFISPLAVIAETLSDLKRISKTSSFTEEDCYIWAVDCIRQIGGNNYEETFGKLKVSNYCAKLPQNFYVLNEIKQCTNHQCGTCLHNITQGMCPVAATQGLIPADSSTLLHCNRKRLRSPVTHVGTYTIKVPPGVMRFSFKEGSVIIAYEALKTDASGIILMQDEIHAIQAVKHYIMLNLLKEGWILGEIRDYVYQGIKNEFDIHIGKAKMKQMFPDHARTKERAHYQDNRYSRFSYKKQ